MIDYANIRSACARLGWRVDLNKLKKLLDEIGTVRSARFYFGTILGDPKSEGFVRRVRREGFALITKPVKFMNLSINVSSISSKSPDILRNFVHETLIRSLKIEAIEYLNQQLSALNRQGTRSLQMMKCNST